MFVCPFVCVSEVSCFAGFVSFSFSFFHSFFVTMLISFVHIFAAATWSRQTSAQPLSGLVQSVCALKHMLKVKEFLEETCNNVPSRFSIDAQDVGPEIFPHKLDKTFNNSPWNHSRDMDKIIPPHIPFSISWQDEFSSSPILLSFMRERTLTLLRP